MKDIIKILLIIIFLINILSSDILATTTIKDIFSQADDWETTGRSNVNTTMDTKKLNETSSLIYNILFGIGVAVAVIVGAILGIQFMTAGIDQKVQVKGALLPYVISCIVVFGSFGIWKLVVTILGSID